MLRLFGGSGWEVSTYVRRYTTDNKTKWNYTFWLPIYAKRIAWFALRPCVDAWDERVLWIHTDSRCQHGRYRQRSNGLVWTLRCGAIVNIRSKLSFQKNGRNFTQAARCAAPFRYCIPTIGKWICRGAEQAIAEGDAVTLSEKRRPIGQWQQILSLCQSSINHLRSIRLDGIAPLTAVTALPPQDPNSIIYQPDGLTGMSSFTEHEINKNNRYTCKISRKHLPLCTNTSPIRRGTRKKRQGADTKRKMACRPLVSNSASLSYLEMPFDAKASIRRVLTEDDNDQWMDLWQYRNLSPRLPSSRSISRACSFSEENIPCYPRLRDYATWAFGPAFSGLQRNPDTHQSEVLVQWRVLDEAEISWEPARILFEDVALLLAQWVRSDGKVDGMRSFVFNETPRKRGKWCVLCVSTDNSWRV